MEIISIGSIKTNTTDELCSNYGEGQSTCTDQKDNLVYAQERIRKEFECSVTDFYYHENKLVYVLHSILIDKRTSITEIYLADGEIILLKGQSEKADQLLLKGELFLKEK